MSVLNSIVCYTDRLRQLFQVTDNQKRKGGHGVEGYKKCRFEKIDLNTTSCSYRIQFKAFFEKSLPKMTVFTLVV